MGWHPSSFGRLGTEQAHQLWRAATEDRGPNGCGRSTALALPGAKSRGVLIAEGGGQTTRSETWPSNEPGGAAADGEKRAADERNRSKAEARNQEAPLGEASLSEERTSIFARRVTG